MTTRVVGVAVVAAVIVVSVAVTADDPPAEIRVDAPASSLRRIDASWWVQAFTGTDQVVRDAATLAALEQGYRNAIALAETQARADELEARAADLQAQLAVARSHPSPSSGTGGARPAPTSAVTGTLARIAQCESGGDYTTNTGNGFYGAYQFTLSTWAAMGGSGLPSDASPAEQDARAAALYATQGGAPWPVCQYR